MIVANRPRYVPIAILLVYSRAQERSWTSLYSFFRSIVQVLPGSVVTPKTSFPPPTMTKEKLAPPLVDVTEPVQLGLDISVLRRGNGSRDITGSVRG